MRIVGSSPEDEMVAVFLRGELDSDRFGPVLAEALADARADARLLTDPDLGDDTENALRQELLERARAYGRREGLFGGFPRDVRWERVALTPDELMAVRYINWSYWLALSGGTRRPEDAAQRIRAGIEAYGVPNDGFFELADKFAAGETWSELIVASALPEGGNIVVEGHARLTAMALARDAIPFEVEVIRGVSPQMNDWYNYAA